MGALRNRRLVGSLLKKKQYNFPALPYPIDQSLLYPPVLTVTPGKFVFCTKSRRTICIFGSLTLRHSKVSRSNLRSRLALPYGRRSAQHWMLCCAAAARCAAGQHNIQYRPPPPARPTVNQSPVPGTLFVAAAGVSLPGPRIHEQKNSKV